MVSKIIIQDDQLHELLVGPIGDFDIDSAWRSVDDRPINNDLFSDKAEIGYCAMSHTANHSSFDISFDNTLNGDLCNNSLDNLSVITHDGDETRDQPRCDMIGTHPHNTQSAPQTIHTRTSEKEISTRTGNPNLIAMIEAFQPMYINSCRTRKHSILKHIFSRATANGARFLDRRINDAGEAEWYEVSKTTALFKIRKCLRSGPRRRGALKKKSVPIVTNLEVVKEDVDKRGFKTLSSSTRSNSACSVTEQQGLLYAR